MGDALEIKDYATAAHKGQVRGYKPEPYIEHPIRVMKYCAEYTSDACIYYAALLHDVLEDTAVKKEEMDAFCIPFFRPRKPAERFHLSLS